MKEKTYKHSHVSGYSNDLYFHDDKLTIEIDEKWHSDRNIEFEIKRQEATEQEHSCELIRIWPDKGDFDIFKAINEIFRHTKKSFYQLTEKTLVN